MTRRKHAVAAQKPRLRRSANSDLNFPVDVIAQSLKDGNYADRIGYAAPVYLAAVLEYLTSEVLELAGIAAKDNGKSRIGPRHIMLVVSKDMELSKVFGSLGLL